MVEGREEKEKGGKGKEAMKKGESYRSLSTALCKVTPKFCC